MAVVVRNAEQAMHNVEDEEDAAAAEENVQEMFRHLKACIYRLFHDAARKALCQYFVIPENTVPCYSRTTASIRGGCDFQKLEIEVQRITDVGDAQRHGLLIFELRGHLGGQRDCETFHLCMKRRCKQHPPYLRAKESEMFGSYFFCMAHGYGHVCNDQCTAPRRYQDGEIFCAITGVGHGHRMYVDQDAWKKNGFSGKKRRTSGPVDQDADGEPLSDDRESGGNSDDGAEKNDTDDNWLWQATNREIGQDLLLGGPEQRLGRRQHRGVSRAKKLKSVLSLEPTAVARSVVAATVAQGRVARRQAAEQRRSTTDEKPCKEIGEIREEPAGYLPLVLSGQQIVSLPAQAERRPPGRVHGFSFVDAPVADTVHAVWGELMAQMYALLMFSPARCAVEVIAKDRETRSWLVTTRRRARTLAVAFRHSGQRQPLGGGPVAVFEDDFKLRGPPLGAPRVVPELTAVGPPAVVPRLKTGLLQPDGWLVPLTHTEIQSLAALPYFSHNALISMRQSGKIPSGARSGLNQANAPPPVYGTPHMGEHSVSTHFGLVWGLAEPVLPKFMTQTPCDPEEQRQRAAAAAKATQQLWQMHFSLLPAPAESNATSFVLALFMLLQGGFVVGGQVIVAPDPLFELLPAPATARQLLAKLRGAPRAEEFYQEIVRALSG